MSTTSYPNDVAPPLGGDPAAEPATRTRRRPLMSSRSPWRYLAQLLAVVVLFGSWEAVAREKLLNPNFVSEPSHFFPSFWDGISQGNLMSLMGRTLYATLVGFAMAAVAGLIMGFLMAEFNAVDVIARPLMNAFNSLPRVALAPLFVLWFGLGDTAAIALVVSLGFFIVAFSTYAGLQSASRDLLLLSRTLGTRRSTRFWKFVLPAASPAIFAGLQLNLTYAFLGSVVAEMLTGSQGIGGYLSETLNTFQTTKFFGALVLLALVAVLLAGAMRWLERYLLRWRTFELAGTGGV